MQNYEGFYLILPADDGSRADTKIAVEYSPEQIDELLGQGYVLVNTEDFNKLIGNADKEYLINTDGTLYEKPPYVPSLDEVKTAKLGEINSWTDSRINGGFVSSCSGEAVKYDSDRDTQLTMQGIALNVNTEQFAKLYPDGCPVRGYKAGESVKTIQYLSPAQVMGWQADLSIHIGTCKQLGWEKQAAVAAATTNEEVAAIVLE